MTPTESSVAGWSALEIGRSATVPSTTPWTAWRPPSVAALVTHGPQTVGLSRRFVHGFFDTGFSATVRATPHTTGAASS